MTNRPASDHRRRGVLLLVVLSMLTLFMLLGAAYLVASGRSRETARAVSRLTFGGDDMRVPNSQLIDRVLMTVVRGPIVFPGGLTSGTFESLLADRYGAAVTVSGTATGFAALTASGTATGVLSGTITVGTTCRPTDLSGRLLTFVEPGRPVTSHRIIRALPADGTLTNSATTAFRVTVDAGWGTAAWRKPLATARVIVNGREFAGVAPDNEPWDGFDANNLFLAQIRTDTSSLSQAAVVRGSLLPTTGSNTFTVGGTSYTFSSDVASAGGATLLSGASDLDGDQIPDVADNDNDGVVDGLFLDFGLPDFTDAAGNRGIVRASVLVVDLDGRFNVNAHDCLSRLIYAGTSNWPVVSGSPAISGSVPLGSGYGPAEVNGLSGTRAWTSNSAFTSDSKLFPGTSGTLTNGSTLAMSENPTVFMLAGGPQERLSGSYGGAGTRFSSGPTRQLAGLEGKYGERSPTNWANIVPDTLASSSPTKYAVPGVPKTDDPASRTADRRTTSVAAADNYGIPPIWWSGATSFNSGTGPVVSGTVQPLPRGVYNSPPDLHGRMRTFTGTAAAYVPPLQFSKAEWADTSAGGVRETMDDPYELRLDTRAGFGGLLFDPSGGGSGTSAASNARDNPFTPAELEPVLRPYDIDSNRLPSRLAAILGSVAEEARLKVTTDSWDTTAITGSAALVLFGTAGGTTGWLQRVTAATGTVSGTSAVSGIIGNELARGERFDLNRPLAPADGTSTGYAASGTYVQQRQAYFKDLYTLLVALCSTSGTATLSGPAGTLSGTAATAVLAQWAANVAEFRDADSRVIPFEYDTFATAPKTGWGVDGDVTTTAGEVDRGIVWGAERPEIVIQETFGWVNSSSGSSGVVVTLHRPWNAIAYGSGTIAGEPCDYAFDALDGGTTGQPQNQINLGKKPATNIYGGSYSGTDVLDVSGTVYPIWRLRVVTNQTQYVAFTGTNAAPGTAEGWTGAASITSGTQAPLLPVDTSFTVFSGSTVDLGSAGTVSLAISGSSLQMPLLQLSRSAVSGNVYLERLSDPTVRLTTTGTVAGTSVTGSTIWTSDPLDGSGTTWPVRYLVIDAMPLQIIQTAGSGTGAMTLTGNTNRRITTSGSAFWGARSPASFGSIAASGTLALPSPIGSGSASSASWMPWPNRPFVSSAELTLVPQGTQLQILQNYAKLVPGLSGTAGAGYGIPVNQGLLFDAVHVPTRFAGIHRTGTNLAALSGTTGIYPTITTVNQFSSFREPGRVNLNTVPADDVWNAVVAGPLTGPVVTATGAGFGLTGSGTRAASPAQSLFQLLTLAGPTGAGAIVSDTAATSVLAWDKNPLHQIYTATRLANTTTPRSNMFAVWVTLRECVRNTPDSVRYRRGFYIVDRSVPVGFEPGRDHNVRDCIRVRRIIE